MAPAVYQSPDQQVPARYVVMDDLSLDFERFSRFDGIENVPVLGQRSGNLVGNTKFTIEIRWA